MKNQTFRIVNVKVGYAVQNVVSNVIVGVYNKIQAQRVCDKLNR